MVKFTVSLISLSFVQMFVCIPNNLDHSCQKCKEHPLRTEFPVFWEFLGIQKFPTMQINSDLKSLELLGISGKGRLQFCEDLESLGIPRNSQLYKLPII